MKILEVKDLSFEIKNNKILKNVSFFLEEGEITSIIGESGSGKTTISKLIMGLDFNNSKKQGKILFLNEDINLFSQKKLREYRGKEVAYVSQNPFNVFHNIQKIKDFFYETILSHQKISKQEIREKAVEILKEVNLPNGEEILEKYPFELSGGMLQRVMIALILLLKPKIIIADEPTSALDSYNREEIINIFRKLADSGITFLIITHDYSFARALSKKFIVIREGDIVEEISCCEKNGKIECKTTYAEQLLNRENYKRRENCNEGFKC